METVQVKAFALLTVLLLSSAASTTALGINCKGSSNCFFFTSHTLPQIYTQVKALNDTIIFENGQHISCKSNICAFLQNCSGTKIAAQIKEYLQALLLNGCGVCGSIPTEPGNDVSTGELTVNWVANP